MSRQENGYIYSNYTYEWEEEITVIAPEIAKTPIVKTTPILPKIEVIPHYYHIVKNRIEFRKFIEEYSSELIDLFVYMTTTLKELDINTTVSSRELYERFSIYIYLKTIEKL
jgi:hypothetical protein